MSTLKLYVIVGIVDEYALARGNSDIEYAVCKMTKGKDKTFETDDPEYEEFVENRDAYWKARGWRLEKRGDRNVLTCTPAEHPKGIDPCTP